VNTGFIRKSEGPSRPQASKQQANQIKETMIQNYNKSIPKTSTGPGISMTIIQNITDRRLWFKP
jgi:hypothetical protein